MEKKSFLLYFDSYAWLRPLSYEEKGFLLDTLFLYGRELEHRDIRPADYLGETKLDMSQHVRAVFGFMADSIYRDTMKWKRSCAARMGKKKSAPEQPLKPSDVIRLSPELMDTLLRAESTASPFPDPIDDKPPWA